MEVHKCQFCKNIFKSFSNMKHHQRNTKYCIDIQLKNSEEVEHRLIECIYCQKSFASHMFKRHLENCKIKKEKKIIDLESIVKEKENELQDVIKLKEREFENIIKEKQREFENIIREKDNIIENMKTTIIQKDYEIIGLKSEIKIYKSDHDCVHEIAKQPKNNTTNNKILNVLSPLDFNVEKASEIIDSKYGTKYLFNGQKGLAKFAVENILKDENGKLNYICADPSRQIFKYKDSTGDIKKDVEAKKLTTLLLEGGITNKASNMAINWWTDEDGEIDTGKFEMLCPNAESMMKLKDDNTIFKKELATMTTV